MRTWIGVPSQHVDPIVNVSRVIQQFSSGNWSSCLVGYLPVGGEITLGKHFLISTHTEALSKWCPFPVPPEIPSCSRVPANNPAALTVVPPGRQSVPCLLLLEALCIYEASPVTAFSSSFVSLADPSFQHRDCDSPHRGWHLQLSIF